MFSGISEGHGRQKRRNTEEKTRPVMGLGVKALAGKRDTRLHEHGQRFGPAKHIT